MAFFQKFEDKRYFTIDFYQRVLFYLFLQGLRIVELLTIDSDARSIINEASSSLRDETFARLSQDTRFRAK